MHQDWVDRNSGGEAVKTFRLMWEEFCVAWGAATARARWLLVIFAVLVGSWTIFTLAVVFL